MIFLTFIARPITVATILIPFKVKVNQILLISWAGLRGVSAIVFAIYVVVNGGEISYNLFNLVFCIVLLSIGLQGTGLPIMAKSP